MAWFLNVDEATTALGAWMERKENKMSLVRWDPFQELEDISNRLNRVFNRHDPAKGAPRSLERSKETMALADWAPAVDIKESPEEYVIKAELPEVQKDDVKVIVKDGVLTLSGERKIEKEEKGKKYHRIERAYGTFMRSFSVPDDVDEAKVSASFKDGLLNVHLPKSATAKSRTVDVKIS